MSPHGLDFTFGKYRELCQSTLKSGYQIKGVARFIQDGDTNTNVLVMRHDVDIFPSRALRMARLEQSQGVRTTYYIRRRHFRKSDIIRAIADMGHEIGYHYEALDEAKGNYDLAMSLFKEQLERLRKIANIETICMHGNPLTKWVNRDLWQKYDFRELGLIGEAYLSLKDVYYLSDTGRIWDPSRKFKDFMPFALLKQDANERNPVTTDDVMKLIASKRFPRIYITIHPERWGHNIIIWSIDQTADTARNMGKAVLRKLTSNRQEKSKTA
jgi:hypothetical protein